MFSSINTIFQNLKLFFVEKYKSNSNVYALLLNSAISLTVIISLLLVSSNYLAKKNPQVHASPSTTPLSHFWVTNGLVYDMAEGPDGTIYLAGDFDRVAPVTGTAFPLDSTTAELIPGFPMVENGDVTIVIPDNAGGWYLGGYFTKVAGETRRGLAHILSDGSVDPSWIFDISGGYEEVLDLALIGDTLYVGGTFDSVAGETRTGLAAIDLSNTTLSTWNPVVESGEDIRISKFYVDGTTLLVGGAFSTINGDARKSVASFESTTGDLNPFFVDLVPHWGENAQVEAFAKIGSDLYIGGSFKGVGAETRYQLVSVDVATGNLNPMDLNINISASVNTLATFGTKLYLGGSFFSVGGETQYGFTVIDTLTHTVIDLETGFDGDNAYAVSELYINGSILYLGGNFTEISGEERSFAAAYDATTDALLPWNPHFGGEVVSFAVNDETVYAASTERFFGGVERNNLVALNPVSGEPTSWNPYTANVEDWKTGIVYSIELYNGHAYIAGEFDVVNGESRTNLAAISLSDGILSSWSPLIEGAEEASAFVRTLTIHNDVLYAGGDFAIVNGNSHNAVATFDLLTGNLRNWNPEFNEWGYVRTIFIDGGYAYIGGDFYQVGEVERNNAAAIDLITAQPNGWDPNIYGGPVNVIKVYGNKAYIGGCFFEVGGQERYSLAATSLVDGALDSWNANLDPCSGGEISELGITDMVLNGTSMYIGGDIDWVGDEERWGAAEIDVTSGEATAWNIGNAEYVYKFHVNEDHIFIAGSFVGVNESNAQYFAVFENYDGMLPTPTPNSPVDPLPTVQFSSLSYTVSETDGTYNVVITLSEPSNEEVTIDYAVTSGTATGGGIDYIISGSTLTIPAYEEEGIIAITLIDDDIYEANETIVLTLSNPVNATLGTTSVFTLTITSDDTRGVLVEQSGGATSVVEGGTTDSFTVRLTSQPESGVTVNLSSSVQYSLSQSAIVFTSGNWSTPITIIVTATDDSLAEGYHSAPLSFTVVSDDEGYDSISVSSISIAITDNDTPGVIITETDGATIVGEDGLTDTISVTLTSEPTDTVIISVNGDGKLTTALLPRYTTSTKTLTFVPAQWNIPQTVTISAVDDAFYQGTTIAYLSFDVVSDDENYHELAIPDLAVTVLDNDVELTPTPTATPTITPSVSHSPTVTMSPSPTNQNTVLPTQTPVPPIRNNGDNATPRATEPPSTPEVSPTTDTMPEPTSPIKSVVEPTENSERIDLKVTVLDNDSKPIQNVDVYVPALDQEKKTDRNGIVIFSDVEEGDYDILIKYEGDEYKKRIQVSLDENRNSNRSFDYTIKLDVTIESGVLKTLIQEAGTLGITSLGVISLLMLIQILPFIKEFVFTGFILPLLAAIFGIGNNKSSRIIDDVYKSPLAFVKIRLFNADTNVLLKKLVTKFNGTFALHLKPGNYILELNKRNFFTKRIPIPVSGTSEVDLESTFELVKNDSMDMATQMPLKVVGIDPKLILSGFAFLIAVMNAVLLRTMISYIIVAVVVAFSLYLIRFTKSLSFKKVN